MIPYINKEIIYKDKKCIVEGHEWLDNKVSAVYLKDIKEGIEITVDAEFFTKAVGTKNDQGKPRMSLIHQEFIDDLLKVLEFGAKNHGDFNWKNVDPVRFEDALYRHMSSYRKGQTHDSETKLQEMSHIAANALFLHWFTKERK